MFIVMKPASSRQDVEHILAELPRLDVIGRASEGALRPVIEVLEAGPGLDRRRLEQLPAVECVLDDPAQVLAAIRGAKGQTRPVPLGQRAHVGGRRVAVIAGPCSVEDEGRLLETAAAVAEAGAVALRGGAFKPRTSPYSFQGHGERALEMLARVRAETGLAVVTEVMSCEHIERVQPVADVLQVGSRNMHNTPLLKALGAQDKPILLKRGWSATLEEFLLAAEYIRQAGNSDVILCERGIRTHEEYVRNTLALGIVPEVKRVSDLPIIVDPSHGTGRAHLVAPMCRAAIACGADGLLIEVHPSPERAWSDGAQSLNLQEFRELMDGLRTLAAACDRDI
ncbi:MAG: 3-deoxy-7-phosphoheptulonate synthase [Planctomycetes bacterium]|nr:3-deoxy-7-phosphoheptulonate synthase [Planctomycetota bacterium]